MQFLVYTAAFLISLAQAMISLAMPLLAIHRFEARNFHLGLLAAGSSVIYTVVALSSGRISERLPARVQFPACTIALAVLYYFMLHAPAFPVLLVLNIAVGFSSGLLWAPLESVLSRLTEPAQMRRNMGRYNLAWSLGMTAGFFLFSLLDSKGFARTEAQAFHTGAALALLTGVMMLLLRAPHAGSQDVAGAVNGSTPPLDPRRRFFLLTAWSALFASYVGVGAARQLFPKLATEAAVSPEMMGRICGAGIAMQTIAMSAMGRLQGWHYRKWIFYVGESGLVVAALLIASGKTPLQFGIGHVAMGAAMAICYSCSLYYSMEDSVRAHHNTAVHEGLIGTAASMSLVLGYLADRWSFTPLSFYISAGVMFLFLCLHVILFARRRN